MKHFKVLHSAVVTHMVSLLYPRFQNLWVVNNFFFVYWRAGGKKKKKHLQLKCARVIQAIRFISEFRLFDFNLWWIIYFKNQKWSLWWRIKGGLSCKNENRFQISNLSRPRINYIFESGNYWVSIPSHRRNPSSKSAGEGSKSKQAQKNKTSTLFNYLLKCFFTRDFEHANACRLFNKQIAEYLELHSRDLCHV